jgi:hypothetical protein
MVDIPDKPFELKLSDDGSGNSVLCVGSTKSGKSYALGYILKHYFSKHLGVLMTNSPQAEIYKGMKIVQSPEFIPQVIKDMAYIQEKTKNHYDFLVVLDDVVTNVKNDKEILKLLTIRRNSAMSTIMCSQGITLLNAVGRTNVNFVLLFKQNTDQEREKIIKTYLNSYFPKEMKMRERIHWFRMNTEDHHFICLDTLNSVIYRTKITE